ncbi:MAG: hypothetical protein HUJ31_19410, partial [Pseudomonadales bacterium]|nr:hypothetical protein [Pseudomonadales bacterium]
MITSRKVLLPFLLALYCASSFGMPVVTIGVDDHEINLAAKVEYYREESGRLGLNQIRQLPADVWQQAQDNELNFGFTKANYWFRVQLHNRSTQNRMMLLRGGYASFDRIEAFQVQDGQIDISRTGAKVPSAEKPLKHRYPLLPIELEGNQTTDLYLKASNSGAFFLPLDLLDWQTFLAVDSEELIKSGAYFGIWLIVIACNLLLYLVLHHVSLLSFATFVFTLGLYQLSTYGLGSNFIAAM